jgi:glycosyltransferase involved in cell wall biosynthesis
LDLEAYSVHIVQAAACPFPSPQGSQVYVAGMSKALVDRGHRVTVACYGHGEGVIPEGVELARVPKLPGYNSLRAGPDWVKPVLDAGLAGVLTRLGRRADLVHAHNYEAPLAAYIARALTGIPVVYNNHNTMAEELHRYFEHPLARALATRAGRVMDRQIPRRADACVAISPAAVPVLHELGCERVYSIPPGVDLRDFHGARPERARAELELGERLWVVYAGNPDPYQDLEHFIDAMLQVPDLGLLMVSASDLSQWESRAAALPPERKRFVVRKNWTQVRDIVAAADIAALPRTVCTGYPIKLLNYLGLGKPTVCAQGSAQDLPGVVPVPNADPAAFAAALLELAQNPPRREHLSLLAAQGIARTCTWDARAQELEQLYEGLLHRAGRA